MDKQTLVKLTGELIRFETVKDNYKEKKKIIEFVKKQFKNLNVYIKEYDINQCPSLVVTLKKREES